MRRAPVPTPWSSPWPAAPSCGPENRDLLRASGRVIWLRARPGTLAERVGDGVGSSPPRRGSGCRPARPRGRPPPALRGSGGRDDRRGRPQPRRGGRRGSSPASTPGAARDTGDRGRAGLPLVPGPDRAGGAPRAGPPRAGDGQTGLRGDPGRGGEGGVAGRPGPRPALRGLGHARGGDEQDAGDRGRAVSPLRPGRPLPRRCGRRHGGRHRHRCRRVRGGLVPPGDGLREHPHDAVGPGRRGHRREDGGEPARREEPGRGVLAARRRLVRHRDPRLAPASRVGLRQGGDGEVRLLGGSAPRRHRYRGAGGSVRGHKGRGGRSRRAGRRPADDPQLRAHAGPCARRGRLDGPSRMGLCATARRWPSA